MGTGITITRIWEDDDMVELRVRVSDGESNFTNTAYVAYSVLLEAVAALATFKDHVHGGLLDLEFGEFGPEYANGAFRGRFHFSSPGRLLVSCEQESEFEARGRKTVASSARLYFWSEPALLDRFITELRHLATTPDTSAELEGI